MLNPPCPRASVRNPKIFSNQATHFLQATRYPLPLVSHLVPTYFPKNNSANSSQPPRRSQIATTTSASNPLTTSHCRTMIQLFFCVLLGAYRSGGFYWLRALVEPPVRLDDAGGALHAENSILHAALPPADWHYLSLPAPPPFCPS